MEEQVRLPLFQVVKGRLVPTAEAHLLYRETSDVQLRVESLGETMKNLARGAEGQLRLAILHSLGLQFVPAAVARFQAAHPQISFEIKTVHSEDISTSLFERTCDVAIAYDVPPHPRLSEFGLGSAPLVMLFHKKDLKHPPDLVDADTLRGLNVIRIVNAGSVGALFNRFMSAQDIGGVAIVAHTYFVAAALVRQRVGVAIVDLFTALGCLSPDLDYRPLADSIPFGIFALHLDDHPLSPPMREFLVTVRRSVTEIQQ
jgi:DNA-binding transcriptional LysR family regulator